MAAEIKDLRSRLAGRTDDSPWVQHSAGFHRGIWQEAKLRLLCNVSSAAQVFHLPACRGSPTPPACTLRFYEYEPIHKIIIPPLADNRRPVEPRGIAIDAGRGAPIKYLPW